MFRHCTQAMLLDHLSFSVFHQFIRCFWKISWERVQNGRVPRLLLLASVLNGLDVSMSNIFGKGFQNTEEGTGVCVTLFWDKLLCESGLYFNL